MEKLERQAREFKRSLEVEQKLNKFKKTRVSASEIWALLELGVDEENDDNPNKLNAWEWQFLNGIKRAQRRYPRLTSRQLKKFTQISKKYNDVSLDVLRTRKTADRLDFEWGNEADSNSEHWNDIGSA